MAAKPLFCFVLFLLPPNGCLEVVAQTWYSKHNLVLLTSPGNSILQLVRKVFWHSQKDKKRKERKKIKKWLLIFFTAVISKL